jgi:protein-tyrosine phosphatase
VATIAGMRREPLRVDVEADGSAGLTVRWEPVGDRDIDIGLGPTPEAAIHTRVTRVPAGESVVQFTDVPPGRQYVSFSYDGSVVIAAERRVHFQGTRNFRDLGGYATESGGRTQWGRIFRSSSLHKLTADDLAAFDDLGIRVIYDLRRDDERTREPGPRPVRALPMPARFTDVPDLSPLRERADGEQWLLADYRAMLHDGGPVFGQLLTALAEADRTPAVFHCAGGKDRTGLAAALLLSWLGVNRETVLDDYELTGKYQSGRDNPTLVDSMVEMGIARPAAEGLLSAPRWTMAEALDLVDTEYGGVEAYLREAAGMSADTLADLRMRFVA